MFDDPYFGMHFTLSGHPIDSYNGEYAALDYLYYSQWIHFRNNDGMYLYYSQLDGENNGIWNLQNSEDEEYG